MHLEWSLKNPNTICFVWLVHTVCSNSLHSLQAIFHEEKGQEFVGHGLYMKHTKTLSIIYRAERKRSPNGQTVPFFMKWGDNLNQTCPSECIYLLVLDNDRTCIFFRWCFHMVEVQRHSTHRWMFEDQWSQKTPLRPPFLLEN